MAQHWLEPPQPEIRLLTTVVSFMTEQTGPPAPDLIPQERQPRTTKGPGRNQAQELQSEEQKLTRHILYCRRPVKKSMAGMLVP